MKTEEDYALKVDWPSETPMKQTVMFEGRTVTGLFDAEENVWHDIARFTNFENSIYQIRWRRPSVGKTAVDTRRKPSQEP